MKPNLQPQWQTNVEMALFASRWLQAPLYFGLVLAQGVYVYMFLVELFHLVVNATIMKETEVMLLVLGLVDVVMIANLLFMVIIGGYETFVSKLYLDGHPDRPEWLAHVDAGVMKIKLAIAMVTISSIHLLKTFINIDNMANDKIILQICIHIAFLLSAIAMVFVDRGLKGKAAG